MNRKHILEKIKEWGENYLIDPYAYDAISYDMDYAEKHWLGEWETAENDAELLEMVQSVFAVR